MITIVLIAAVVGVFISIVYRDELCGGKGTDPHDKLNNVFAVSFFFPVLFASVPTAGYVLYLMCKKLFG